MKKLFSLIAIAAFGLTSAFAQTPSTASAQKPAKKEVKTTIVPVKATTKTITKATNGKKAVVAKTNTKAPLVKKDGTADMRFKANKAKVVAKPAGPTKKDGTADMRYKANKPAKKN